MAREQLEMFALWWPPIWNVNKSVYLPNWLRPKLSYIQTIYQTDRYAGRQIDKNIINRKNNDKKFINWKKKKTLYKHEGMQFALRTYQTGGAEKINKARRQRSERIYKYVQTKLVLLQVGMSVILLFM